MIDIAKEAMAHVKRLCVDIGHRPIGSPGDHAAADYLEHIFRGAGLDVERQVFSCPTWDHEETALELDGQRLEAVANWFSLPCEVRGAIVPLRTLDALKHADLAGRVALLHGKLTRDEIVARASTVFYPSDHRKINNLLDEKRPAAVITESPANFSKPLSSVFCC